LCGAEFLIAEAIASKISKRLLANTEIPVGILKAQSLSIDPTPTLENQNHTNICGGHPKNRCKKRSHGDLLSPLPACSASSFGRLFCGNGKRVWDRISGGWFVCA
jgi:hypothetical protein